MENLKIEEYSKLSEEVIETLVELETQVFDEPLTREIIEKKLGSKSKISILIGYIENKLCAYKVGFQCDLDPNYLYSWIGGVVPAYRRLGIARALMERQHELAKAEGFKCIRTRTKNKYRSMLILNLRAGFDVVDVYTKAGEKYPGIVLEKEL